MGNDFVIAFTDRRDRNARLYAAALDANGQLTTAAHPLTAALGDQALTKLVTPSHGGRAYILWENLQSPTPERRLQIAAIDEKAQLSPERLSIAYPAMADRAPEVVSTPNGLALLTQVPDSLLRNLAAPLAIDTGDGDEEAQQVPVFTALSDKLKVEGMLPLIMASRPRIPNLAWGLECRGGRCFVLGALSNESEAAVLGVALSTTDRPSRSLSTSNEDATRKSAAIDAFENKLRKWLFEDTTLTLRPKLAGVYVVSDTVPLADLAVSHSSAAPWVSTLTFVDPTAQVPEPHNAQQRRSPPSARVELRSQLAEASTAATIASFPARSEGGVAWAALPDQKDPILAFSAQGQRAPQVFVARFDRSGKKATQRQITQHANEISDIAAVGIAAGYFVGWIDNQATGSIAEFARLTHALDRKGPEQFICKGPGIKTGLNLLAREHEVWATWSDTRQSSARRGDIFLMRLAQSDGHALGAEQRLFETPPHSHSPQLAQFKSGVVVVFMESEPREEQPEGIASVHVARLDESGHPGSLRAVQVSRGIATGFGIDCLGESCRIAVATDIGGTGQIEVAAFDPKANDGIRTLPLVRSLGPADESVSPVVVGNDVYWVDRGLGKLARVVRAVVAW